MEFHRIIEAIAAGLTGDAQADAAWLHSQMERYRSHELGRQIVKACRRMLSQLNGLSAGPAPLHPVRAFPFRIYRRCC